MGTAAWTIGRDLAAVLAEQQELTTPPNPPATGLAEPLDDTTDLGQACQLAAARDALAAAYAEQRLALLTEHVRVLRRLYRTAAARYAAAAVAVTQAAIDGTDPRAVLPTEPLPLDEAGRPVDLSLPVTGLNGLDADIAGRHRIAVSGPAPVPPTRSRRRAPTPMSPADAPAEDLTAYADYLAGLVKGGQLTRLRLRV